MTSNYIYGRHSLKTAIGIPTLIFIIVTGSVSAGTLTNDGSSLRTVVVGGATTSTYTYTFTPSISNLINISYAPAYINWTWTDPSDIIFARVMVYINGIFKTNVSKGIQYYNATSLIPNTTYTISTHSVDTSDNINKTWVNHTARTARDSVPPASITNLKNISYAQNYIKWTWTDPSNADFTRVMIYINGIFRTNVPKGIQYYNATSLLPNTVYTISTHTMDTSGNINKTWINHTAITARDAIPPASITNLKNISYAQNYIKWTWTDPSNADFTKVMIYINGVFRTNVPKGVKYYNATGLIPNTAYTISTHTMDTSGNINKTWINHTARTARDAIPPASITNLKNISYARNYIKWTWTDPSNADFTRVMIYINGIFKTNVSKGVKFYNSTSLVPNTAYTISTHTVDTSGNINITWRNHTARTAR